MFWADNIQIDKFHGKFETEILISLVTKHYPLSMSYSATTVGLRSINLCCPIHLLSDSFYLICNIYVLVETLYYVFPVLSKLS